MVLRNEAVCTGAALPYPYAEPAVLTGNGTSFFIGYVDGDGCPYTRESDHYRSRDEAERALDSGRWSRAGIFTEKDQASLPPLPIYMRTGYSFEHEALRSGWCLLRHVNGEWTKDEFDWITKHRGEGVPWGDLASAADRCSNHEGSAFRTRSSVGMEMAWRRSQDPDVGVQKFKPSTYRTQQEWNNDNG